MYVVRERSKCELRSVKEGLMNSIGEGIPKKGELLLSVLIRV